MSIIIFESETSTEDEWLAVGDDGTLTYVRSPSGWAAGRKKTVQTKLTAEAAKARWPQYAARIDEALRGDQA